MEQIDFNSTMTKEELEKLVIDAQRRNRGKSNRAKGKRGEKEFLALLQEVVDSCDEIPPHRRPQVRRTPKDDGADIIGVEGLAFEIKRQERLQKKQWWKQACLQAEAIRDETLRPCRPVLAYRVNHTNWFVIMDLEWQPGIWTPCEIELEPFLDWFRQYVISLYGV